MATHAIICRRPLSDGRQIIVSRVSNHINLYVSVTGPEQRAEWYTFRREAMALLFASSYDPLQKVLSYANSFSLRALEKEFSL